MAATADFFAQPALCGRQLNCAKLGGGDCHHAISRRRPQEAAALQPLGIKRHTQSIVPKDIDQLAAFATEHIEVAPVRVSRERFLHQQDQRVHAATHIGVAGRNPHPHARRNGITVGAYLRGAATAAFSVAASTSPVIRIRAPAANSISIDPPLLAGATGQGFRPDSATTIAGTKPA
uniref:hypothetical protein n=1 Tax=Bradyrhizobium sp. 195 TaxID=2782662 RepID=UPI002000DE04|nr:hypothetical protein [Bradyrhizobium sp. 195]